MSKIDNPIDQIERVHEELPSNHLLEILVSTASLFIPGLGFGNSTTVF